MFRQVTKRSNRMINEALKFRLINEARNLISKICEECKLLDPYSVKRKRLNNLIFRASARYVRRQYDT